MEHAYQSALENNVHRNAGMGTWVLINARWYKLLPSRSANSISESFTALASE
jgi:hypothetical protein